MVLVAPSILSADMLKLGEELNDLEQGGADWVHVDVMDGKFVPNITMGPIIVDTIDRGTNLSKDVHLMIEDPSAYIPAFADSGADLITISGEAIVHLDRTINQIKGLNKQVGVALNPATPLSLISWIIQEIDLVLIMSVNPGFSGQKFIPYTISKIKELDNMKKKLGVDVKIQVDGGVNSENAGTLIDAGADVLVAGSAVFSHPEGVTKGITSIKYPKTTS